jgi:flavin-dependent dehydrogenase
LEVEAVLFDALARTRLIGQRVGNVAVARSAPVRGYPAGSAIREQIDGPGWVAIGEAATTYDPLSGRGVPMALLKGAAIARLIVEGASGPGALHRYAATERETFADYLDEQRKTYRRTAHGRKSPFWSHWQKA